MPGVAIHALAPCFRCRSRVPARCPTRHRGRHQRRRHDHGLRHAGHVRQQNQTGPCRVASRDATLFTHHHLAGITLPMSSDQARFVDLESGAVSLAPLQLHAHGQHAKQHHTLYLGRASTGEHRALLIRGHFDFREQFCRVLTLSGNHDDVHYWRETQTPPATVSTDDRQRSAIVNGNIYFFIYLSDVLPEAGRHGFNLLDGIVSFDLGSEKWLHLTVLNGNLVVVHQNVEKHLGLRTMDLWFCSGCSLAAGNAQWHRHYSVYYGDEIGRVMPLWELDDGRLAVVAYPSGGSSVALGAQSLTLRMYDPGTDACVDVVEMNKCVHISIHYGNRRYAVCHHFCHASHSRLAPPPLARALFVRLRPSSPSGPGRLVGPGHRRPRAQAASSRQAVVDSHAYPGRRRPQPSLVAEPACAAAGSFPSGARHRQGSFPSVAGSFPSAASLLLPHRAAQHPNLRRSRHLASGAQVSVGGGGLVKSVASLYKKAMPGKRWRPNAAEDSGSGRGRGKRGGGRGNGKGGVGGRGRARAKEPSPIVEQSFRLVVGGEEDEEGQRGGGQEEEDQQ
ncbi:hypothetical protein PR202_ga28018 [Eleusine coracana subsp. coracana]|uniref:Uncharacterized protein n=1 Tax=Eleusine coracana subsp. coracana TaxID=191504 RepID=A0AAV5DHS5_ELECO|nr:hypothetical protein PR202_ga28018 [Eleusine coracana subsp. coracana]